MIRILALDPPPGVYLTLKELADLLATAKAEGAPDDAPVYRQLNGHGTGERMRIYVEWNTGLADSTWEETK